MATACPNLVLVEERLVKFLKPVEVTLLQELELDEEQPK